MRSEGGFVYLDAAEMAGFDRVAIEEFGVDELLLMENAGVAVAKVARAMLGGTVGGRRVLCLVGKGNNGGDGLVAARHLQNWGAAVALVLGGRASELREIPAKQLGILQKMGIGSSGPEGSVLGAELLIDALLGYNLKGNPKEPLAGMIRRANLSEIPILAVDIPSGLDATTGEPGDPCVVADTTVTFGLPKEGFLNPKARRYTGDLYVADLSFPSLVYERYSMKRRLFEKDALVKVW